MKKKQIFHKPTPKISHFLINKTKNIIFFSNQAKNNKEKMRRHEPNQRVSGANDFGVVEFVSEANHEAAKGLVAVKASIVSAHALQRRVNRRARREGE